jgi:phenylalanyl-tRNA synthetase beta chain
MLESGLQVVAYNLNRRSAGLKLFEFGRTYTTSGTGRYDETTHLCLYVTGNNAEASWKTKKEATDFYTLKGLSTAILKLIGVPVREWSAGQLSTLEYNLQTIINEKPVASVGLVSQKLLKLFDIRQPVFFADFSWDELMYAIESSSMRFTELPKQLPVQRDLAIVVPRQLPYDAIEKVVQQVNLPRLKEMQLFDIFESEKLGTGKKSMAVSFTFLDEEKTLNDKEIDAMMQKIMTSLETSLQAEIRK